MSNQKTITKTLKFRVQTNKKTEDILRKLTARHTFAITRILAIIESEQKFIFQNSKDIGGRLDSLTLKTKYRSKAKYDLKKITGLSYSQLQSCNRKALEMFQGYRTLMEKWKNKREIVFLNVVKNKLNYVEFSETGIICNYTSIEVIIDNFTSSIFWKRMNKNKPSLPLQSKRFKLKKIPMRFNYPSQLINYSIIDGKLFVRISTLIPRQPLTMQLITSEYHLEQLENSRITGGEILRNYKSNSWEFHATIRKSTSTQLSHKKNVILGIDLGLSTEITVVALIEGTGLRRNQFHFLKDSAFRKRKFELSQNKKILQAKIANFQDVRRTEYLKQLRNVNRNYANLMKEYHHKLSKQVSSIAEEYQKNYNVHIAIGSLKGLKFSVRKSDGKSKRFRGRISQFPYIKLTNLISYKCKEIGIESIELVDEYLTSKTCHKCGSKNTKRPTQALFHCLDCGIEYNADANGAINIALKYWQKNTKEDNNIIKKKFINRISEKRPQSKAEVNGFWEKTHQDELAESRSE